MDDNFEFWLENEKETFRRVLKEPNHADYLDTSALLSVFQETRRLLKETTSEKNRERYGALYCRVRREIDRRMPQNQPDLDW